LLALALEFSKIDTTPPAPPTSPKADGSEHDKVQPRVAPSELHRVPTCHQDRRSGHTHSPKKSRLPERTSAVDRQLASGPRKLQPTTDAYGPCVNIKSSRKEVIQPHLPVRLPCYDFVPIAGPTFDGSLPQGVRPPASGVTDFHDVTGGVYKARERIHRSVADLRLLATPTSRSRVADYDPN
jgi:hypothetical protein